MSTTTNEGGSVRGPHLAVFVSPHGFGHAARASAVMEALHRRTGARFEVFSTAPRWFFDESVEGLYRYHEVVTDVGFTQKSALEFDLEATTAAVASLVPFDDDLVDGLALEVRRTGCRAVLCDIAPLGIAVADRAGVPSVLVENFTWSWLYEPLLHRAPALGPLSQLLDEWVGRASLHLLAEPYCHRDARAHGSVRPVSRPPRVGREELREGMELEAGEPVVVLTMGGYDEALPFLDALQTQHPDVTFLITGAERTERRDNLRLYDNRSRLYMPHLVRAADAVVAKLGYSTVAEVWREGRPLAFVTRPDFPETPPLRRWVEEHLEGFEIDGPDFAGGGWTARIPELLATHASPPMPRGGADEVVDAMLEALPGALD